MAQTLQKKDTYLNELFLMVMIRAKKKMSTKTVDLLIKHLNESCGSAKIFLEKKVRYNFIGERAVKETVGEFLECCVTGIRPEKIAK